MISYAKLNLSADIRSIQQEVAKILANDKWMGHYNKKYYDGEWNVLPLRSPGGDCQKPFAELMNDTIFQNTALLCMLPAINDFLKSLRCEKQSVRLLNLKPGAVIKEHRDIHLAFEMGEARLHVPVFTNNAVEFYSDNDFISMKEGECWYINANLPHRVINNGNTDRVHLVIDCCVNDWLKTIFDLSEKKYKEEKIDPELQRIIIHNLRAHQTEAAAALADKLENEMGHE